MKKTSFRALSILLTLVMLAGILAASPFTAFADDTNPQVIVTGPCGSEGGNATYYCFADGSMAIFGAGAIADYDTSSNKAPWYGDPYNQLVQQMLIHKIAVEYGITRIGDYCFYLDNLRLQLYNIDIANTVTEIGQYAFANQMIQQVVLPPSVRHIGLNAFQSCALNTVNGIIYYGDPGSLVWEGMDDPDDSEFLPAMKVHILNTYTDAQKEAFNARFANKHITFVNDMENPYAQEGEDIDRNIAAYYGSVNSRVFGGAAPYIIIGRFDAKRKSVTHGSNGFASCVCEPGADGKNHYYLLTDNTTGALNEATFDTSTTAGVVTGYVPEARQDLKLFITHEYIGANTVKMIYTLKNTGSAPISNLQLGGTGDIKIGADDYAAIEPLMEEGTGQVGIYMKSGQAFDQAAGDLSATLGFIGKNVQGYTDKPANFFYGQVGTTRQNSAAGIKSIQLIPERIFTMKPEEPGDPVKSYDSGPVAQGKDTGMSFYWDVAPLRAGESRDYAVLFSVYGTNDTNDNTMLNELNAKSYTVDWVDSDGTKLFSQVVKLGDAPVYAGPAPDLGYKFDKWVEKEKRVDGDNDVTYLKYQASYTRLFYGHSLTLNGDIGVNFFLDVSPEQVANGVKVRFDWYDYEPTVVTLSPGGPTRLVDGKTCYIASCKVSAAEMTDNIHATAYFKDGDDWVEYTKEYDDYTVYDYGMTIVRNTDGTFSNTLVDLAKKMLDYGAKAQILFGHNNTAAMLANKSLTDYQMTAVSAETIENAIKTENTDATNHRLMTADTDDFGLTYVGTTVVLLSETSLRHYYTVAGSSGNETIPITDTWRAANYTCDNRKPGYVFFEKKDIAAADLDVLQSFTIGGHTYRYAVLDFAKGLLAPGRSRAENDMASALYWYNQAANSYFPHS